MSEKSDKLPLRGIELFCGTKSFTEVAEKHGIDMFTIDFNPKFNPDICMDILYLTKKVIPKEFRKPDILWCSPPCETFSMSGNSMYMGFPTKPKTYIGLALAYKCIEMIQDLRPKYWFIENPRAGLRSVWFMRPLHKKTVTYCQYGERKMKPTDIFTNLLSWEPAPPCKNGTPCHDRQPRGYIVKKLLGVLGKGTQGEKSSELRSIIPEKLCDEIVEAILDAEG